MKLIPKLILVLLAFAVLFSLLNFSAQFGDLITGNVAKVSESTPFALFSVFILITIFLIIALIFIGILSLRED